MANVAILIIVATLPVGNVVRAKAHNVPGVKPAKALRVKMITTNVLDVKAVIMVHAKMTIIIAIRRILTV